MCFETGACEVPLEDGSYYYGNSEYDNDPVILVSWYDAQDYCHWAERVLPTEAQWEKAARGTEGQIYPWGNEAPNSTLSNYDGNVGNTTAVGSYLQGASPYGAMDMAGNVWEWVNDWYSESYYYVSPVNNPPGPATGTNKVFRGGSWHDFYIDNATTLRSAFREFRYSPDHGHPSYGFRCALSE